jgi:hypothetical protein
MQQMRGVPKVAAAALIGLVAPLSALWTTAGPAIGSPAGPAALAAPRCASGVPGDVNGDGYAEVAVGEPGNAGGRGALHVFYGQRSGLVFDASGTARDDQYFTQATAGVPGAAEAGDRFGTDTVLADFNDDGCADLAVGSPGENATSGFVHVFYGSPSGLRTTGVQGFGMAGLFGSGSSAPDQELGDTLTAADLNGDGIDDLASGVAGLDVGGQDSAGGVALLYGSTGGLNLGSVPAALLTRDTPGVPGTSEELGGFGVAVATGDFDGDDKTELAVGATNGLGGGSVQVVRGEPGAFHGGQPIGQSTPGMPGREDSYCAFGLVIAAGDVHGDGRDDLAVSDPSFDCHNSEQEFGAGVVMLLPGSSDGLTTSGNQLWRQSSPGVQGAARTGHVFGESLAMGRLDGGSRADLAIGAPGDRFKGSVTVLLGSPTGLTTAGVGGTSYTQATPGIAGSAEIDDNFGEALTAALVQSRSRASLIIGSPGEDVGEVENAGSVTQLSINDAGPKPSGSRTFTADTRGVQGKAGQDETFGGSTRRWG